MRFLFLFFFATNIFALNWKAVIPFDDGIYYVDIDSIKKSNGMVYYWDLEDRYEKITIGGYTFMSSVAYKIADCDMNRTKILKVVFYEKNMKSGRVQYSEDYESPSWKYIVPGSVQDLINEYVCSKG
tara:strand:+ start:211 stop:591 length:381 start_codon:yes stop_codon:yes gene_type:complete